VRAQNIIYEHVEVGGGGGGGGGGGLGGWVGPQGVTAGGGVAEEESELEVPIISGRYIVPFDRDLQV
jgi:hypothetical protein